MQLYIEPSIDLSWADSGVKSKFFQYEVTKISEITATLPLTEFAFMHNYRGSFKSGGLGRIYEQLPLKEPASEIRRRMLLKRPQGKKPVFPPECEIALMFLRSYTGMSDD